MTLEQTTSLMRKPFYAKSLAALLGLFVVQVFATAPAGAAGKLEVIAGAGPSTKVTQEFVKLLAEDPRGRDFSFQVPEESVKHQGGIDNTASFLFGRTGRPLNEQEKAAGYEEILLAKMPIVFVAGSRAGVRTLTQEQVCSIYTGAVTSWKEVGGSSEKIILITREPGEALLQQLKKDLPCMSRAAETRYVLKNDTHLIEMLKTMELGQTAIGFGAAGNFPEAIQLKIVDLDSGGRLGLVYKAGNRDHPLVQAARQIAGSPRWLGVLKTHSFSAP